VAGGPISIVIELQGARAVAQHWAAIAAFTIPAASQITGFFGGFLASTAREIHTPNIDTGATFASISPTNFSAGPSASIDVGPETAYAIFQEFGFTHHLSGKFIQNPFMIPAADAIAPLYVSAIAQLAEIAANRTSFNGPGAGAASSSLTGIRSFLYSFSKFAGDVQVFGIGGSSLVAARSASLQSARLLGDVSAGMGNSLGKRFTIRTTGSFATGGIRSTISGGVTGPSSSFSSGGRRIVDRIAGRVTGGGLKGI